jgi:hypothetical protein
MTAEEHKLRTELVRIANCMREFSKREERKAEETDSDMQRGWSYGMAAAFSRGVVFIRVALETKEDLLAGIDPFGEHLRG